MESISPVEVSSLLNRPNAVDDVTRICQFFTIYPKTPQYLQTVQTSYTPSFNSL